jgi:hypothetical protein
MNRVIPIRVDRADATRALSGGIATARLASAAFMRWLNGSDHVQEVFAI